jgi:hypothetical protein
MTADSVNLLHSSCSERSYFPLKIVSRKDEGVLILSRIKVVGSWRRVYSKRKIIVEKSVKDRDSDDCKDSVMHIT